MEDIILQQLSRYPEMEIQDVIKLAYQAEFGCEHLIRDQEQARRRLHAELESCGLPLKNEPLYESIGEGLCRLNLRPARMKMTEEDILGLFLSCGETKRGSKDGFRLRMRQLTRLCESEKLPFDPVELDLFLASYSLNRCQPLSHSVHYHELYRPAYRIVKQKELKDLLRLRREE